MAQSSRGLRARLPSGPDNIVKFDTDHVITRGGTYNLFRTDTINASPAQMDFSVIAQRTAKDNLRLNLIQPKDDELYFGWPD